MSSETGTVNRIWLNLIKPSREIGRGQTKPTNGEAQDEFGINVKIMAFQPGYLLVPPDSEAGILIIISRGSRARAGELILIFRDFPGGSVVKTVPSNVRAMGSIPGHGAKIPHALGPRNQNINNRSNIATSSIKALN